MQGSVTGRINAQLTDSILGRLQASTTPDGQNSIKVDADYKGVPKVPEKMWDQNVRQKHDELFSLNSNVAKGAHGLTRSYIKEEFGGDDECFAPIFGRVNHVE